MLIPKTISLNTKIVQGQEIFASAIDDEVVMAHLGTDNYYGLGPVSTRIWKLIEEPKSLNELCILLMEEFDVDVETCHRDLQEFVKELLNAEVAAVYSV